MSVLEHSPTLLPAVNPAMRRRKGMSMSEAFRVAFQGLAANKLRSFLTMLGIIIGVGSVIVMVALGQGVANATQESIRKLGTNVMSVFPNSQNTRGVNMGMGSGQNMQLDDVEFIKKLCPSVKSVSPEYRGSGTVKFQNQNTRTTVMGVSPGFFEMRNMPIEEGKIVTEEDVKRKSKVAVIGYNIKETIFGAIQPVGKYIKINGQNFKVIGVVEKRGASGFRSPDDQVNIPVSTAMRRVFGSDYLTGMTVQATNEDTMLQAQEEVEQAMKKAHHLGANEDPDVRVFNQADLTQSAAQQSGFLTMLLAGIAMVSLIVGGIGIMNIMLVSVTERTREIGIRKALGAKRKDILDQFLIESVTLSLLGGLLGIGIGIGIALWMQRPSTEGGLGFPMLLSLPPIVISFMFSAFVGIFFGIYPAMKASRLDPIEALRYE